MRLAAWRSREVLGRYGASAADERLTGVRRRSRAARAADARLAARREWALNEKRIVQRAGMEGAHDALGHPDLRDAVRAIIETPAAGKARR